MTRQGLIATTGTALLIGLALGTAIAQQGAPTTPSAPTPYLVGNRLGMPINPAADGAFNAMSDNVKVYGSVYSAESCSYDPVRGVIVVPNRGVGQNVRTNDAWITFLNHDGSVHTSRWVGVQNPGDQRNNMTPPLVLNEPLGSDIVNGMLYLADRDGGTGPNDPAVSVIRRFNMQTGMPGRVDPRREIDGIQRYRGRRRRHDLRDADGSRRTESGCDDVAGVEDHPRRQRVDLRPGRAAASAQRHRLRSAGQHRRRQHRHRGCHHVLPGWQS